MAISGLNRSYATAAKVDAKMLLTFWTQPGAPAISPSPANAMGFRALALYELAAMGVTNPEVIACPSTAVGPVVKVPPEVIAIIKVRYAKLAPLRISNQWSNAVDVKAESVTPHICVYADGRQVSYYGKVPTNATQAISVLVDHAPWPITGGTNTFVRLALIPNQGWIVIDEGSSP
ncbi:hypothetical protein GALL_549500 [mine drainage metagenome]|uniref:Uncharacterized protein n=1 Tax=mine drainage metagenome TaxID=410659 RepID=A0A1J5NXK1_9ZZZZ